MANKPDYLKYDGRFPEPPYSTTDNAAAGTQHTASPVSDSPTQPAAPTRKNIIYAARDEHVEALLSTAEATLTSWCDRFIATLRERGCTEACDSMGHDERCPYVFPEHIVADFARRLEALVHQQHSILSGIVRNWDEAQRNRTKSIADEPWHVKCARQTLAAYAALEKEIERG